MFALGLAGALFVPPLNAQYADSVVGYSPGSGVTGSFLNPSAALGGPSRTNPFGESVDPFNPPYGTNQIVSIGTNGFLTLQFDRPILNDPANPFGLDFIVFGNAGFTITNGDFTGGGITDGSLFSHNTGSTRVSVSLDNVTYYTLDPLLALTVDGLFPTDTTGNFQRAVDPALRTADFSGRSLSGIRALYNGSGGGTGFDLAWAQDTSGHSVVLPSASFVRIEVLSGKSEIDAIAAARESRGVRANHESFSSDPGARGWRTMGDGSLFHWNATNGYLEAVWDSSRSNSFYYRPLGTVLTRSDDFILSFMLRLQDLAIGVNPAKPSTFEIAVGLINRAEASRSNLRRGVGIDPITGPQDLVEFAYFPDSGFGATISPTMVSSNNQFAAEFDFPLELTVGADFLVSLAYTASNRTLVTIMTRDGQPFGPIKSVRLGDSFTDFQVDAVSISSYSDAGADGSILAHGIVDDVAVVHPTPPVSEMSGAFTNGQWRLQFQTQSAWRYALERTEDFQSWIEISTRPGDGGQIVFTDTSPPASRSFYRVRAERQ